MKDNRRLGFLSIIDGYVATDYNGTLTQDVVIGAKNGKFRVYAYLWHNEQDASREGKRGEVCGRGNTPQEAIDQYVKNALKCGWEPKYVYQAELELEEKLKEQD